MFANRRNFDVFHRRGKVCLLTKEILMPFIGVENYVFPRLTVTVPRRYFCCGSLLLLEGRIWDLIVSVTDHCLSFYLVNRRNFDVFYKRSKVCLAYAYL